MTDEFPRFGHRAQNLIRAVSEDNARLRAQNEVLWEFAVACAKEPGAITGMAREVLSQAAGAASGGPPQVDLSLIPENWWLYGLFHNHTRIVFAGDSHKPITEEGFQWTCKLQHRHGGRLTEGQGDTPNWAVIDAVSQLLFEKDEKIG